MVLSQKKRKRMEHAERVRKVNERSLNGHGYFMDAGHEADARLYIETGDVKLLNSLPNYPAQRAANKRWNDLAKKAFG